MVHSGRKPRANGEVIKNRETSDNDNAEAANQGKKLRVRFKEGNDGDQAGQDREHRQLDGGRGGQMEHAAVKAAATTRTTNPAMDPDQTYILSGPFLSYDQCSLSFMQIFTAEPVPRGMTVIATPALNTPVVPPAPVPAPVQSIPPLGVPVMVPPQLVPQQQPTLLPPQLPPPPPSPPPHQAAPQCVSPSLPPFNPDAAPFVPRGLPSPTQVHGPNNRKTSGPCFMYWSAWSCPEGRLVPLRQPLPPVYFLN